LCRSYLKSHHAAKERLQETPHCDRPKYLELRGITPKNTQILHEFMISKDRRVFPKAESKDTRKNLAFLTKLCGFILFYACTHSFLIVVAAAETKQ
jgi:hypothetical protein